MRITIDEKGYVTGWSVVGDEAGILCEAPEDFDHFAEFYQCYLYTDGVMTIDQKVEEELRVRRQRDEIRRQRETECFPFINRGALWYKNLTNDKLAQLEQWYIDWLDAPETMTIPSAPVWLK